MKKILLAIAVISIITACGKKEELDFATVESARMQANENSEFNAKAFRQKHPEYSAYSISMRGDSSQSSKCGQGDGWASLDLVDIDKNSNTKLKCSTVSAAIGCMSEEDFKTRQYASEDGVCNETLPFPLPKIQK
jgi:predicted small lipoprotein YifL